MEWHMVKSANVAEALNGCPKEFPCRFAIGTSFAKTVWCLFPLHNILTIGLEDDGRRVEGIAVCLIMRSELETVTRILITNLM